jgi:hypothetical protein
VLLQVILPTKLLPAVGTGKGSETWKQQKEILRSRNHTIEIEILKGLRETANSPPRPFLAWHGIAITVPDNYFYNEKLRRSW